MAFKYQHSVLGGTFDHLHSGHRDLLEAAFTNSAKVTIGLGTEKIYSNKFLSNIIQPYQTREKALLKYFEEKQYHSPSSPRAGIIPLSDIYGTTLEDNDIEAIFVTDSTKPNAIIINQERERKNLQPYVIINVPLRKDENGEVITSERIRTGLINRRGEVFMNIFKNREQLIMPEELREELRHPLGKVIKDLNELKSNTQSPLLISVGDIVTQSLHDAQIPPHIEIIDFKTQRHTINSAGLEDIKLQKIKSFPNAPGTIHKDIANEIIKDALSSIKDKTQNSKIIIDGEEDLLTLPAILLAPLGSIVCYGQFDLNSTIAVEVTEETKQNIYSLLSRFQ